MAQVDGISALLLSTHMMLAMVTKTPEITIDKSEADILASNIAAVAAHYDIQGMSEKGLAWYGLAQALGIVYGPRIFAARARKSAERSEARRAPPPDMSSGHAPGENTANGDNGLPGAAVVDLNRYYGEPPQ